MRKILYCFSKVSDLKYYFKSVFSWMLRICSVYHYRHKHKYYKLTFTHNFPKGLRDLTSYTNIVFAIRRYLRNIYYVFLVLHMTCSTLYKCSLLTNAPSVRSCDGEPSHESWQVFSPSTVNIDHKRFFSYIGVS